MKGWFGESYRHYLAGRGFRGVRVGGVSLPEWRARVEAERAAREQVIGSLPDIPARARVQVGRVSVPTREFYMFPRYQELVSKKARLNNLQAKGPAEYNKYKEDVADVNRELNMWIRANAKVRPQELWPKLVKEEKEEEKGTQKEEKGESVLNPIDEAQKKREEARAWRAFSKQWREHIAEDQARFARRRMRDAERKRRVRASTQLSPEELSAVRRVAFEKMVEGKKRSLAGPKKRVVRAFEKKGIEVVL